MSEQYYGVDDYWKPKSKPLSIKVEELTDKKLKFTVDGQTHTLFNPLRMALLEDEDVAFVAYKITHPLKEKVVFVLETKEGSPLEAIERALKRLRDKMNELRKNIIKAVEQESRAPYFVPEDKWEKFVKENF